MSWANRPLRFTVEPHSMDGSESFETLGGYVGHDDGQDIKLGSYVPTTNRDGFCHSPEQGAILNFTQGGFTQWASTGEPVRLFIGAVAGAGKTATAETIAKLWANMGLGREPMIMTAFNNHIAGDLKAVAKGLRKDLQGFQSMGYSNTASAGGRKLVFDMIRENGFNPVMDDRSIKYRNLSRIAVTDMIDTRKLMELRMITNGHEDVKSEVAGWFSATKAIYKLVKACMSAGVIAGDYTNDQREELHSALDEIIMGVQDDDVHFTLELFGLTRVRRGVKTVIMRGLTQLSSGEMYEAEEGGFAPDSTTGAYSRRTMIPVEQLLGSRPAEYDALGLRFPLVDRKKKPETRSMHQLGCLAKTDTRAGVSGSKKVLAEWVKDGSLCLRSASYPASQMVIGNSAELGSSLGINFEYAKRDGSITLVNLFRAVSDNNFAPVPLTQYRVRVPAERASAVLDVLLSKLKSDVEIAQGELDDGTSMDSVGGDIHVDFADFTYAPVALKLRAKIPASLLIIDEVQDFSELQGRFIMCFMNEHTNLVAVGDVNQSLYLFNFADSEATSKLVASHGCTILPMTVCWRNSHAVVAGVHDFMAELKSLAELNGWEEDSYSKKGGNYSMHKAPEYLDSWPEGKASITIPAHLLPHAVELGDLVTCRVNAPLAKLALRTLIDGEKSITLPSGKGSIADNVMKIVRGRMKYRGAHDGFGLTDGDDAVSVLTHDVVEERFWKYQESQLEASIRRCGGDLTEAKKEQRDSELMDTASATLELLHGFIQSREQLNEGTVHTMHFSGWLNGLCGTTEGRDGHDDTIRFASVHRTKGAQGNRAFVVIDQPADDGTKRTFMLDHCMNSSAEVVQELNAGYVAVTRAKLQTVFVSYDRELMQKYPTWESFQYIWEGPQEGRRVVANHAIIESDFPEAGETHTHAEKGDTGVIIHVEDGFACVRFDRTQTATDVGHNEVSYIVDQLSEVIE